jgi:hypothetical protein
VIVYVVTAELPDIHDIEGGMDGEFLIPGVFSSRCKAETIAERYERDGYYIEIIKKEIDKEDANTN